MRSNLLTILQLFDGDGVVLTVDDIADKLGISVRTAYRNVRELTDAQFLDPVTGAGYVLGPAFIHFDRLIRQNDPLIRIADGPMEELLEKAQQAASVILCRRFRDRIISVHARDGAAPHPAASYERGVGMSLFVGAPAKVILAFMPDRALQALYLRNEDELRATGAPPFAEFRQELKRIKRQGFAVTASEVGSGRLGIAAPIVRQSTVIASISMVIDAEQQSIRELSLAYAVAVMEAAATISRQIGQQETPISRA